MKRSGVLDTLLPLLVKLTVLFPSRSPFNLSLILLPKLLSDWAE